MPRQSDLVSCDWVNETYAHAQLTIHLCIKELDSALSATPMGFASVMLKEWNVRMMDPAKVPFVCGSAVALLVFRFLEKALQSRFSVASLQGPLFPPGTISSDAKALPTRWQVAIRLRCHVCALDHDPQRWPRKATNPRASAPRTLLSTTLPRCLRFLFGDATGWRCDRQTLRPITLSSPS